MDLNSLKKFDLKKVLPVLDSLVERIPESITSILKKVAIAIFGILAAVAIYYGIDFGRGLAQQEGQELAKDTKTLFREEIEREYNRRRKDIRMPDNSRFLNDDNLYNHKMKYDTSSVEELNITKPIETPMEFQTNPNDLRSIQNDREIPLYPEDLQEIRGVEDTQESSELPGRYEPQRRIPRPHLNPEIPSLLEPNSENSNSLSKEEEKQNKLDSSIPVPSVKSDTEVMENKKAKKLPLAPVGE